ncbi:ABC transporter substrate-binding protein [Pseudomonas aeruginosa]
MNGVFRGALALLLGGLLSVLAHAAESTAHPEALRIAVPDSSSGAHRFSGGVVDLLVEQRTLEQAFAKDGVKVQWVFVKGAGPAINEAFANRQIDLAYYGDLPAMVGRANGLDTQLLAAEARGIKAYLGVLPDSAIHRLDDLRGKHLAVFRGTIYHLSLINALASAGLTEKDLRITNMDIGASNAALATGQVDAVWGANSLLDLERRGLARVPLSTRDLDGVGSTRGVLVGAREFVQRYPDVVLRVLQAQQEAYHWLSNPANKVAYLGKAAEWSGYPAELLQRDLGDQDLGYIYAPGLDAGFLQELQSGVELSKSLRLVRRDFRVQEWAKVDLQVRAAALVEGNRQSSR